MKARYVEAWQDLNGKGLSGCARQIGALWQALGEGKGAITDELVKMAIESGVENAPKGDGADKHWTLNEAESHFWHLGLLWSPAGDPEGPWEMGLPSFFGYVDRVFSGAGFPRHRDALPALEADMAKIMERGAKPKADVAESREKEPSDRQPP